MRRFSMWIDKYKPKSLDEMILNPNTRIDLQTLLHSDLSFVLHGPPGCGKGCFTDILVENSDYIFITSYNQDINFIKEHVIDFCIHMSLSEKFVIFFCQYSFD